jgi:hypothetical protein
MRTLVLLLLFLDLWAAVGRAQTERWVEHAQPGGGVIELPEGFSIVDQVAAAVAKPSSSGAVTYSQALINAKGLNNGVMLSIKASRVWRQDERGRVLEEAPTKPEHFVRGLPDQMRRQGLTLQLIDGPSAFANGEVTGWYISMRFNNDLSRIDHFTLLKGGILYNLTATYQISGAHYWTPKTREIVSRWQASAIVGDLSAVPARPASTEWQAVAFTTGERFALPPSWVIVSRDSEPRSESEDGQTITVHHLLNIRPNRAQGDVSTVNVLSYAAADSSTKQPLAITDDALSELHNGMATSLEAVMKPATRISTKHLLSPGLPCYLTPLVADPGTGIPMEGFVLSLIRGDRAYMFMVSFPPGQSAEFQATIADILDRSTFLASSAVTTLAGASPSTQTSTVPAAGFPLDPTMLLVSFALTWGIGLTPPLLVRYAIWRRPVASKVAAAAIAGGLFFVNVVLFTMMGSTSKTHGALMLVCWASYGILRQGAARGPTKATQGSRGSAQPFAALAPGGPEERPSTTPAGVTTASLPPPPPSHPSLKNPEPAVPRISSIWTLTPSEPRKRLMDGDMFTWIEKTRGEEFDAIRKQVDVVFFAAPEESREELLHRMKVNRVPSFLGAYVEMWFGQELRHRGFQVSAALPTSGGSVPDWSIRREGSTISLIECKVCLPDPEEEIHESVRRKWMEAAFNKLTNKRLRLFVHGWTPGNGSPPSAPLANLLNSLSATPTPADHYFGFPSLGRHEYNDRATGWHLDFTVVIKPEGSDTHAASLEYAAMRVTWKSDEGRSFREALKRKSKQHETNGTALVLCLALNDFADAVGPNTIKAILIEQREALQRRGVRGVMVAWSVYPWNLSPAMRFYHWGDAGIDALRLAFTENEVDLR